MWHQYTPLAKLPDVGQSYHWQHVATDHATHYQMLLSYKVHYAHIYGDIEHLFLWIFHEFLLGLSCVKILDIG